MLRAGSHTKEEEEGHSLHHTHTRDSLSLACEKRDSDDLGAT